MMILNQMMDILWQPAAAVANGTTRSAWTLNLKFFEMRSTTCNRNSLFAENKVYELYNLYNGNKGLISRRLMYGEIFNSSCLDFFWKRLFEVVLILNFTFTVFYFHGATVTLLFHDSVLIFFYISCFQKSNLHSLPWFLWCLSVFFLRGSPACCELPLSPTKSGTNNTLVSTTVSIVLQKVGLRTQKFD